MLVWVRHDLTIQCVRLFLLDRVGLMGLSPTLPSLVLMEGEERGVDGRGLRVFNQPYILHVGFCGV